MDIQAKRRYFHALLASLHMQQAKELLLESYGASSTTELTDNQLDELIAYLKTLDTEKTHSKEDLLKHWRHKCLRVMSKIIDTSDWERVNTFMLDKRIAGKHLYELTIEELTNLHKKLNRIKDIYEQKDAIIKYKASLN